MPGNRENALLDIPSEDAFFERVMRYLEGDLPSGAVAELQRELSADSGKRQTFVAICVSDSLSHEELSADARLARGDDDHKDSPAADSVRVRGQESMTLPAIAEEDLPLEFPLIARLPLRTMPNVSASKPLEKSRNRRRGIWLGGAAIIAAPLMAVWVIHAFFHTVGADATLTAAVHDTWGMHGRTLHVGDRLPAGELSLESGLAEIRLGNGTRLILEGPSRLEIRSDRWVDLNLGKLTVVVTPNAHGFAVQTPSSRVVDQGTEFGVLVETGGASETHVIRGTVECTPSHAANAAILTADHAARVEAGGDAVRDIGCRKGDFAENLPAIDLIDVVAGGDGTQRRRNGGINVADGGVVVASGDSDTSDRRERLSRIQGDGKFHPCAERRLIAGVFIPHGGEGADTLDPAGNRFNFPTTDNQSYNWLWGGGKILTSSASLERVQIGDLDYAAPGHGVLLMHANKGVSFNLDALRIAHPDRPFSRCMAICVNATAGSQIGAASARSELWAFVDGKLRFRKSPLFYNAPPFKIDFPIEAGARYLTLAVTDGGDGIVGDWVVLGDLRLQ